VVIDIETEHIGVLFGHDTFWKETRVELGFVASSWPDHAFLLRASIATHKQFASGIAFAM
jgi:hypothetical protein